MSRPLIANQKRQNEAAVFHRDVFREYAGPKKMCYLCGKSGATDAAHVLGRGTKLGPLRYASPRLARPAHRLCHERVDRHEIDWPLDILRDAILAHNEIAKVKLEVP